MALDSATTRRLTAWLNANCQKKVCPTCEAKNWLIDKPGAYVALPATSLGTSTIQLHGRVGTVPMVLACCGQYGNIASFLAARMGLLDQAPIPASPLAI